MKAIYPIYMSNKKHSCRQGDPYQDRPTLIRLQWNNWIHHNNLLSPSVHLCLSVSFSNVNFGLPSSPPLAILACRSSRLFAAAAGSTHTTHTRCWIYRKWIALLMLSRARWRRQRSDATAHPYLHLESRRHGSRLRVYISSIKAALSHEKRGGVLRHCIASTEPPLRR